MAERPTWMKISICTLSRPSRLSRRTYDRDHNHMCVFWRTRCERSKTAEKETHKKTNYVCPDRGKTSINTRTLLLEDHQVINIIYSSGIFRSPLPTLQYIGKTSAFMEKGPDHVLKSIPFDLSTADSREGDLDKQLHTFQRDRRFAEGMYGHHSFSEPWCKRKEVISTSSKSLN